MITKNDFRDSLMIALNSKTLYVKGGFGLVLNAKGKERAINSYPLTSPQQSKPKESLGIALIFASLFLL